MSRRRLRPPARVWGMCWQGDVLVIEGLSDSARTLRRLCDRLGRRGYYRIGFCRQQRQDGAWSIKVRLRRAA